MDRTTLSELSRKVPDLWIGRGTNIGQDTRYYADGATITVTWHQNTRYYADGASITITWHVEQETAGYHVTHKDRAFASTVPLQDVVEVIFRKVTGQEPAKVEHVPVRDLRPGDLFYLHGDTGLRVVESVSAPEKRPNGLTMGILSALPGPTMSYSENDVAYRVSV